MNNYIKNARGDNDAPVTNPQVLTRSFNNSVIDIFLDGDIVDPERYREAYHALANASMQDIVFLHINTVGGRLDTGVQLINHINRCEAKVIGVLHMECASMGSGIFLACDDWELNTFSTMMIHSCSYGTVGKQSDILSRVEFTTKFNERYIRETYSGFLSEDEIKQVLRGDELYFNAEQIDERLVKFLEYRTKIEDDNNECDVCSPSEEPSAVVEEKPAKKVVRKVKKEDVKDLDIAQK